MNTTLINRDFEQAVKRLRRILPKLSFGLLIGTYLISALIMGIFHAEKANNIGLVIAAFLVPLAIQAGRGTLVFFFQLNPSRIQSRFSMGIVAATALLILSLWEAWLVMNPYGLAWTVSVSTLMLIGWVVELMILKETMFATQMQLYQNKEQWIELHDFYIAQKDFEQFMEQLYDGKRPALPQQKIKHEVPPQLEEPKEIGENHTEQEQEGNELRPSLNGHP